MWHIFQGVVVLGVFTVYMIPAIEADARQRDDAFAITLVNVLLGWTVIGWIAALMWARHSAPRKHLAHFARRTQRAVARVTIQKLMDRSEHRAVLQRRSAGKRRTASNATI